MGIVYQLTFFLNLGLLGVVIAIFVFAAAQVGKATEVASKEQQGKMLQKMEANSEQIKKLEKQLEKAKEVGKLDKAEMRKELRETTEALEGYDREIKRINERIILIRRKGAVVYPGACFMLALALSITSSGLAEGGNLLTLAMWVWIISIGILVFGIYRVFRTLGAIEEVTITSEEARDKLPEAVKSALLEMEEEKRPELALEFVDEKPPLNFQVGEEKEIRVAITLKKGIIARQTLIHYFAPLGFEFPGRETFVQSEEIDTVGGYVTVAQDLGNCRGAFSNLGALTIKAPAKADKYIIYYRISCEDQISSTLERFDVVVK